MSLHSAAAFNRLVARPIIAHIARQLFLIGLLLLKLFIAGTLVPAFFIFNFSSSEAGTISRLKQKKLFGDIYLNGFGFGFR
jgi:hypothetical protein